VSRRVRLGALQTSGLLFFVLILAVAASGVIGGAEFAGKARESIWRVAFVYAFLMLAFRLTGKREVGQMSPIELLTLMMIPEIFSVALNRNDPSMPLATVAVTTLFLAVFLTGILKFRSKKADELLEGTPTILVDDGVFVESNLQRERITPDEIVAEMRIAGIDRIEKVRWAILETEGKIAIIPQTGVPKTTASQRD
jgi:uncharacterized membrane protein YcaP (DUF421 family)